MPTPNVVTSQESLSRMKLFVEAKLRDPEVTQKQLLHSGRDAEATLKKMLHSASGDTLLAKRQGVPKARLHKPHQQK